MVTVPAGCQLQLLDLISQRQEAGEEATANPSFKGGEGS